ncbi:tyrosine-protein phosphatase non-receptor type 7-like [Ostrea edulis]|uniref:tyrosine-protein phosphatase non-receptor type 7-like n=1 Tax=Ostrea edulis TaxID=37623 RepID=UPI002095B7ED|nr:tyrosine-protein phosphatase non-receptor type 7-like [Ostrea edulis]
MISEGNVTMISNNTTTNSPPSNSTTCQADPVENADDSFEESVLIAFLVIASVLVIISGVLLLQKIRSLKVLGKYETDMVVTFAASEDASDDNLLPSNERNGIVIYEEEIGDNDVEEEDVVAVYCNLQSLRVSVEEFLKAFPEKKACKALEQEFKDLPSGLLEPYTEALKPLNKCKNRYKAIYPYDHSRVILDRTDDPQKPDYINASYIAGYKKEKAYIAAQGPFTPDTIEDFWTLIWQTDCTRIVMLTNLYEGEKMKCLRYWTDDTESELDIGPYHITLDAMDQYEHYTIRYLIVSTKNEEIKRVTQFHFTTWSDNSVPEDLASLICFRNLVRNGLTSSDGPIVVHCSAGIGRTGTFIALDFMLEEGTAENYVDVKSYIVSLRQQRGKCIQTYEQYVFLHEALVEGFQNSRQNCLSIL